MPPDGARAQPGAATGSTEAASRRTSSSPVEVTTTPYAIRTASITPSAVIGDLGTKGGVVTDADSRALREDGSVIEGLYAAGNTSASVMGRTYPGPGSTIGPASVFGVRAARHMGRR